MGTAVGTYIRKTGKNPLVSAISRNETGEIVVDLGRVLKQAGVSAGANQYVSDMVKSLGSGAVRASDLEKYNATYKGYDGAYNEYEFDYSWNPINDDKYTKQAYQLAMQEFKKGEKAAAKIAQEGRDKARQANFGAELAAINRRALAASEDNSYEQVGGSPDVVLSSDTDADDAPAGQGRGSRRRRSAFFSGGGLLI